MDDFVLLQGNPAPRGEQLALCQKNLLKQRINDFKALCDKLGLGPLELPDRARQITQTLNVLCQEWLIEARAVAACAQIPTASFMAITYPPEKVQPALLPKRANDSTSLAACSMDPAARTLFLENCDGPDIVHHVISRAESPGTLAYVALAEAADIGIKAFLNEAGLAGTFHMGPPVDDYTSSCLQPTLVLRQLCERATSCAQAASEFETLQKRMGPATPDRRGVCYLFADSAGEIMLLEATATKFKQQRLPKGFLVSTNKFQLTTNNQTTIEPFRQRCLNEHLNSGPLTPRHIVQASRVDKKAGSEKGVCDAETRASFVAVLGGTGHPCYALVTLGSPLFNLPVPLFPRMGVPAGMVDGSAFTQSFRMADPSGGREQRRAKYETILYERLASIASGATDDKLMAITAEMWKLAREYAEAGAAKPAVMPPPLPNNADITPVLNAPPLPGVSLPPKPSA
ncbi:MAG TPA: carcinine hydrolase/isopenicillin-N N-acyltransferase family protein [Planctomycetota bacterium]|nr:carcinine hydrolase/isopenicillin-N N-acyltransferase family protein [Planctomycetota bacterium]